VQIVKNRTYNVWSKHVVDVDNLYTPVNIVVL